MLDLLAADGVPRLSAPPGEPVPSWDMNDLVLRQCVTCSEAATSIVCYRPDGLPVAKCAQCNTLFLPLIPSDVQLNKYYQRYSEAKPYLQDRRNVPGNIENAAPKSIKQLILKTLSTFNGLRGTVTSVSEACEALVRTGGVTGKRVLEIGPGPHAGMLDELAKWGAYGEALELDERASLRLEVRGFKVHRDISDINGEFDIIYAGMMLEHISNPRGFLTNLSSKAAKIGTRILLSVPNAEQAQQSAGDWIGFRVDLEHLNYFDLTSLSKLLSDVGFQIELSWKFGHPILPDYLAMADRSAFLAAARQALGARVVIGRDPLREGGEFSLAVMARKWA